MLTTEERSRCCCSTTQRTTLPVRPFSFLALPLSPPPSVLLLSLWNDTHPPLSPTTVKQGDRIAQLILERIVTPEPQEVASLSETQRGAGGFGSTGGFGAVASQVVEAAQQAAAVVQEKVGEAVEAVKKQ